MRGTLEDHPHLTPRQLEVVFCAAPQLALLTTVTQHSQETTYIFILQDQFQDSFSLFHGLKKEIKSS